MKRVIYFAIAALLSSCGAGSVSYTLSGAVEGVSAGDSVMLYTYANSKPDSALAAALVDEDGNFTIQGEIPSPQAAVLLLNGQRTIGALLLEAGSIEVATAESGAIEFTGTPLNDKYTDFLVERTAVRRRFQEIDTTLSAEEVAKEQDAVYDAHTALIEEAVDANINSVLGAFIFATNEFTSLETAQAVERMAQFSEELQSLPFMEEVAQTIQTKLRTEVGQPYIDIKMADAQGVERSVSELLSQGKYVLIDFWASWCGPCMAEMPHLKQAYAEFAARGFEIYGVSLDRTREAWIETVDESMPWVNVMRMEGSTATEDYAVRTIPSNFLISPEGIIIAKNLRGEEVAVILSEHIK